MASSWTTFKSQMVYPSGLIVSTSKPTSGMYGSDHYTFEKT